MEFTTRLERLAAEAERLGDAAARCGLDDPVPGCPDWRVRDLVGHVGTVHRWAEHIVANGLDHPDAAAPQPPHDGELLGWYADGHRALVSTLAAAPADLSCFAFLPAPSPLEFWARRQLHETTIHRADAEAAAAIPVTIDDATSLDGIEEMLFGFAKRRREFVPGTVRLAPDGSAGWLITLGPDGASAVEAAAPAVADATVSGRADQVYLWLWNRPAEVSVTGDHGVADRWQQVKVRWG
ncbi:MAG TPA: maleylpyruvate isomerase family mycothiol-dependent enzyme [Mycobacteriales bacterium]|nr:maleylpyruvate isomerase family mycothiol-dependent enzyme [Mycobacteriales bacterium]